MTSARRPTAYRPRRDPREIVVAVLAVIGVVMITVVLLFLLKPSDEKSPSQPTPAPLPSAPETTVPGDTSASSTAPPSLPETTVPSAPGG
jgi:hypothetical protein